MRDLSEIKKDVSEFYKEIENASTSPNIQNDRDRFIKLREEMKEQCSKDSLFSKKLYTSSSIDYDYDQMRDESMKMMFMSADEEDEKDEEEE